VCVCADVDKVKSCSERNVDAWVCVYVYVYVCVCVCVCVFVCARMLSR